MKRIHALLAVAIPLFVLLPGCGGDDDSDTAESAVPQAAAAALGPKLLAVSDLPAGWAVDNTEQEEPAGCIKQAQADIRVPERVEAWFRLGPDLPQFGHSVASMPAAAARSRIDEAITKILACSPYSFEVDDIDLEATVSELSFGQVGDTSRAIATTLRADDGSSLQGFTVSFQVGDLLGSTVFADYVPDVAAAKALTNLAAEKMRR